MYLRHFNLRDWPFALTPNMALYYPADPHQQILLSVKAALEKGEGFVKVTGEVGTGKTLLCRMLLEELRGEAEIAYITTPITDPDRLLSAVVAEFGITAQPAKEPAKEAAKSARTRKAPAKTTKVLKAAAAPQPLPLPLTDPLGALQAQLLTWHRRGRRAILVIDEAQALGLGGLEALRLLSNLETETAKLLQIVMFGQPELDRLLSQHEARQIRQRIAYSFTTAPLRPEDVAAYVAHRLEHVAESRVEAKSLFARDALADLARASGGIPRLVNILADKALLSAYGQEARLVGRPHLARAIADSTGLLSTVTPAPAMMPALAAPFRMPVALPLASMLLTLGVALVLGLLAQHGMAFR